ncbi:PH-interacting protein isoform X2 [Aricia agestis]|uniref:PH-interacting protein isoform X2 n=1 Tax=Aricia agestis TaxID=91739 RepID=UPI001C201788|nr:PH-interacting protein isoform X2 [Aricia agestis]
MEDHNEELNVAPELYFLIAKFLSGGPLKETAKTLLKELDSVEVLPRRLDWEGNEHPQAYSELDSQYSDVSSKRLLAVCEQALRLAQSRAVAPDINNEQQQTERQKLSARLSLLSESLVRNKPEYASFKEDHTLVRRLLARELGGGYGGAGNGYALATAPKPFPRRILKGLQLQRRTLGHLSAVYCLVFDCTGRYAVTGADDLLVKVWSAMDGRPLATLRGAGAEITDVCASSDGALLACGSVERLVRVWCLKTGAPKAVLSAHAGTITSVHWSPLGGGSHVRLLASTSTDGSVAFWTCAADGQFLSQPVQYVERMRPGACHMICAAWSAGGAFLAAGSADQHVRVYAAGVGGAGGPKRVLEAAVHTDAVDSLAWARRGLRFVSGSKDGTAALWQLHATQWRHTLLKATTEDTSKKLKVTMVCWDCSDEYIMTAVSDHTVRVWSSRTATQLRSLSGHKDEAYVLEAHPILPGVLLSAGHDGLLLVWDALTGEELARFHNLIEGQGEGAIFDAKWGGAGHLAAADSHGHLLLLGLGAGHPLLARLPTELFFHTDYRPLVRDALGGALDEQTELPPHLMPPPFLVDVEGAPHEPEYQRLVPGRENLALDQLMPAARSRLDAMIEALANEPATPPAHGGGVWRGEGVRHTAGAWQALDLPLSTRPVVPQLPQSVRDHIEKAAAELHELELSWYRREMRRRPVMISTAGANDPARRRPGRRPRPAHAARAPREARPAPRQTAPRVEEEIVEAEESGSSDTSDESVRLSGSQSSRSTRSERYTRSTRSQRSSVYISDSDSDSSSASGGKQSASSAYSDWEAGAALQPPARARRRPAPRNRYSPSAANAKRAGAAGPTAGTSGTTGPAAGTSGTAGPSGIAGPAPAELPEVYRVGEWLTAVSPRKAPYHPQMGDHLLYFRLGHQRYFEAVAEKDVYKVNPRDKPWERDHIRECEQVQVIGMKYVIKPPRVVCLKLSRAGGRALSVRYHDMPDVIDFLVLRHHYDAAVRRRWGPGDRFRCMIDDSWWTGEVLERLSSAPGASAAPPAPFGPEDEWAAEAASHFLSLRVRWDNGEVERLSPWDLEPLDPERLPSEPGGAVPVLRHELEAVVGAVHDWPSRACATIANHISQVMTLSAAEPFVAPVDLQLYPAYALVVPYPVDLATIRARFENKFYRRAAAAQFDARYLASNAEQFNESHSPIVRQARLVTDLLLYIISNWEDVDVVAKYHELAASYHSSDDEVLATKKRTKEKRRGRVGRPKGRRKEEAHGEEDEGAWRAACASLLRELCASADAEPFRAPVSPAQAPDYLTIVSRPMDLGTVSTRLAAGEYASAEDFAADVRLVFTNSRLYNTNKRSRIYSMTVRLSSLFEALWALVPATGVRQTRHGRHVRRPSRHASATHVRLTNGVRERRARTRRANMQEINGDACERAESAANGSCSSESEPLAETSRRVHAERADSSDSDAPLRPAAKGKGIGKKSKSGPSGASSSTSRVPPIPDYTETNGAASQSDDHDSDDHDSEYHDSDNSIYTRIEVVEEELADDEVQLEYEPPAHTRKRKRKRRRRLSSGSYTQSNRKQRKLHPKRTREPRESGSWSSSSSSWWSGSEPAGRYESDRSFHPQRVSSDDDAPLTHYRQRQEDEPGPSRPLRTYSKRGGVSLRSRLSPRRYNEDSEEDSAAAISKRLPHAQRRLQQRLQQQRMARAPHTDHDYFNGHAHAGTDGSGSGASGQAPVSISSRGRVRKLTAKARGLLRD